MIPSNWTKVFESVNNINAHKISEKLGQIFYFKIKGSHGLMVEAWEMFTSSCSRDDYD